MDNKNVLYGVIGLLIGVIMTNCFYVLNRSHWDNEKYENRAGEHQMPDGTMMGNVPMNMESMMGGMMAGLQGKTGDAFDKEFLSQMIVHHQGAVEMAKAVLATSKRPELIKLANDIISAQTKEIEMMQEWQKAWFK